MPRRTTNRATRRSRVRSSDVAVGLRPAQPVVSEAGNDAAQIGNALGEALGIGGELAGELDIQRAQEDFQQGIEDFEAGIDDPELAQRSEEYRRARTQLKARADWAHDKKELEAALRKNGFEEMSEDEVNGYIDEFYRQKYEGYDDPDAVEWLAPRMSQFRQEVLAGKAEITDNQLKEADGTRLQVAFRDALEENPEDPSEAYELLATMSGKLFDGKDRNDMYAKVLFDYAIDTGQPELLDNMPDYYPGSKVPTIKNNPNYQDQIRSATVQAQAVKDSRAKQRLLAEEAAAEEANAAALRQIYLGIGEGKDPLELAGQYLEAGIIDDTDYRNVLSTNRTQRDDRRSEAVQHNLVAARRAQIAVDPTSVKPQTIIEDYAAGVFGPVGSEVATDGLDSMLEELERSRDRAGRVKKNPAAAGFRRQLAASVQPKSTSLSGLPDNPGAALLQEEMLRRYDERVAGGEDPAKVFWELQAEGVKRKKDSEAFSFTFLPEGDQANPAHASDAYLTGGVTAEGLARYSLENGLTPADYEGLKNRNPIMYRNFLLALKKQTAR